jgi:hypothetical protein
MGSFLATYFYLDEHLGDAESRMWMVGVGEEYSSGNQRKRDTRR